MCARTLLLLMSLAGVAGCANLEAERAFRKVSLGVTPTETLGSILPAPATRTTVGYVSSRRWRWPEVETAVVVLGPADGKADAKFLLTLTQEKMGRVGRTRAVLTAELLGRTNPTATAGPVGRLINALRRLGQHQHKTQVDQTHQRVAAAVIRLLESLPDVRPPQSEYQRLDEALARIPPNGSVTITNQTPGSYRVEYRATGGLP